MSLFSASYFLSALLTSLIDLFRSRYIENNSIPVTAARGSIRYGPFRVPPMAGSGSIRGFPDLDEIWWKVERVGDEASSK